MIICNIKVLLAQNDMKQKDLAIATGIRPSTITDMCRDNFKAVSVENLDKICKALKCQPGDLFTYQEEN